MRGGGGVAAMLGNIRSLGRILQALTVQSGRYPLRGIVFALCITSPEKACAKARKSIRR